MISSQNWQIFKVEILNIFQMVGLLDFTSVCKETLEMRIKNAPFELSETAKQVKMITTVAGPTMFILSFHWECCIMLIYFNILVEYRLYVICIYTR